MANIAEQLRVWIEALVAALGYPGIAIVMFVETIFPPIPSELVLPFAGFLVAEGRFSFFWVVLSATLGALAGALVLYQLGRLWGEERARALVRSHGRWALLTVGDLDRSLALFRRHDGTAVFWARMLPLMRSLISLPAGIARMGPARFILFTALGTLVWNLLLSGAGILLGQNWTRVLTVVDRFETAFWILVACLVTGWVVARLLRRRGAEAS